MRTAMPLVTCSRTQDCGPSATSGEISTPIHRAGMKKNGARFGEAQALGVELIKKNVVIGGERRFVETFGLDAKNENDVGVFEGFFDAENAANRRAGRADFFKFARNPHRGAAECELAAEFREEMNVGARDAAVLDVAEDSDVEVVDSAEAIANREGVEETLRGMLVRTIAGVD